MKFPNILFPAFDIYRLHFLAWTLFGVAVLCPTSSGAEGPSRAPRQLAVDQEDPPTTAFDQPACDEGYSAECEEISPRCARPGNNPLWVRAEYLFWWTESIKLPALVTSSPVGTPTDVAGVLGQPGTDILFGDQGAAGGVHPGGRISFGCWLTPWHSDAIEASYLGIAQATTRFQASDAQAPILARPFFDTEGREQASMLVAYPGLLEGSISAQASTELQSAEVLWRRRVFAHSGGSFHFLAGYRFARLDENVHVDQFSEWTADDGVIIPGTTLALFDDFDTRNQFHGAQFGAVLRRQSGYWSAELLMKVALGSGHSIARVNGATHVAVPGDQPADFVGGLLAQETNIGRYERNDFSVLPELGVTLGCRLTPRLRATIGYTLLCWTNIVRPAEQIDLEVSQFPPEPPSGARRPQFEFLSGDFWAQGLSLGLDYRF